MTGTDRRPLRPGSEVEVRSDFDGTWTSGFTVVEGTDAGYRIKRTAEDLELPEPIPDDRVRRARRRETWWI